MLFPIWNLEQFVRKRKIIYYAKSTLSRKTEERNCAITVEEIDFVVFIKHVVRWNNTFTYSNRYCATLLIDRIWRLFDLSAN